MIGEGRPRAQRSGAFLDPGGGTGSGSQNVCPAWCVVSHGAQLGEEDWVHTSAPVPVADGMVARLCLSVDPATGSCDGPYVLVGTTEYLVSEAVELGLSLIVLARAGEDPSWAPSTQVTSSGTVGGDRRH
jgi:hypothetical protein